MVKIQRKKTLIIDRYIVKDQCGRRGRGKCFSLDPYPKIKDNNFFIEFQYTAPIFFRSNKIIESTRFIQFYEKKPFVARASEQS